MFGDQRTRLNIFHLEAMAKICAFYYTNIKKKLFFYGKELSEYDLKDSVNGSIIILVNWNLLNSNQIKNFQPYLNLFQDLIIYYLMIQMILTLFYRLKKLSVFQILHYRKSKYNIKLQY